MYAVIQTGGKQYRVQEGDVIFVEKLPVAEGDAVNFDVLFYQDGDQVKVGQPTVAGAAVEAKVVGHGKDKKIYVFKYKAKKNIRKKTGHRQPHTKIEIVKINA